MPKLAFLKTDTFIKQRTVFHTYDTFSKHHIEQCMLQVVEGMDVVKKVESFGSQSGKTSKKIIVADCGQC